MHSMKGERDVDFEENKDILTTFHEIIWEFKDDFLLIIDDAEDLLKTSNKDMLKEFLEIIFEAAQKIKVLLTSKIELGAFLGGINGVSERVIKIMPLSIAMSEQLLKEKSGKEISEDEKRLM